MTEDNTAAILDHNEPLLDDGGTDHLLGTGGTEVTYPHEMGRPVTPERLYQHMAEHPEAYHPDLQGHISRQFGGQVVAAETLLTPEGRPYTREQLQQVQDWLEVNDEFWDRDMALYNALEDAKAEGFVDQEYKEKAERRVDYLESLRSVAPPVPIDKRLAMELATDSPFSVLENAEKFQGLDEEVAYKILLSGNEAEVADSQVASNVLLAGSLFGLKFNSKLLNTLMDCWQSNSIGPDILDMLGSRFEGLTAADAHRLARWGEYGAQAVQRHPKKFEGLKLDSALALDIIDSNHPESFDIKFFTNLDDRVARRLLLRESNYILNNLFRFKGLSQKTLAVLSESAGRPIREFPHGENRRAQYEWYANMSYTDLRGWPKTKLGQLIALRIEQGLESDLHDATQWLSEFDIASDEGLGWDIATIQALLASGEDDRRIILDRSEVQLVDLDEEENLLKAIVHAPAELRARLNLPTKDQKVGQIFYYPENRLIYESLLPLFKQGDFTLEGLREVVLQDLDTFYDKLISENHKHLAGQWTRESFRENVEQVLAGLESEAEGESGISELVRQLQAMGEKRKAYIDDAMSWLLRHGTSPSSRLVKVWKDRPLALATGAHDSARAIEVWQRNNSLRITVDEYERSGLLPEGLIKSEILSDKWKSWRETLMFDLSAANTLKAIGKGKNWLTELGERPKALLASSEEIELKTGDKTELYKFDVLAADDPRGFVIGEQTGCCMTIDGASATCIQEGYRNPNAGFLALYGEDGRIRAQSFWYVHPEYPDVLVLDNIEANAGRDFSKITSAYQQALRKYIERQRAVNPDFKISKVHVGEGYTEVNISHLQNTQSIPPLNKDVYTDAAKQRLLLDMNTL